MSFVVYLFFSQIFHNLNQNSNLLIIMYFLCELIPKLKYIFTNIQKNVKRYTVAHRLLRCDNLNPWKSVVLHVIPNLLSLSCHFKVNFPVKGIKSNSVSYEMIPSPLLMLLWDLTKSKLYPWSSGFPYREPKWNSNSLVAFLNSNDLITFCINAND